MKLFFESYEYLTEEDLLEASAKTDFRDKFGQQALDNFDNARQRLKNKGMSVDYGQYLKMTSDELDNLILSLYDDKKDAQKKRVLQGKDKEIRGKYNYIGEYGGFKIYEPLDVQSSMDLGVNTGWCTTGRYGHAGHPDYTPSIEDAEQHFNEYSQKGIRLFYFLNPKTMYGEWALALYPITIKVNATIGGEYILNTNFELFDANDDSNYSGVQKLPLDKLNVDLFLDKAKLIDGLLISDSGILLKASPEVKSAVIPESVTKIARRAFQGCYDLKSLSIPNSVEEIGASSFFGCIALQSLSIPNSVVKIGEYAFLGCDLQSLSIPKRFSDSLESIGIYESDNDKLKIKFT